MVAENRTLKAHLAAGFCELSNGGRAPLPEIGERLRLKGLQASGAPWLTRYHSRPVSQTGRPANLRRTVADQTVCNSLR